MGFREELDNISWILVIIVYLTMVGLLIMDAKRKSVETLVWEPEDRDTEGLKIYEENILQEGLDEDQCQKLLIKSEHNLYNLCVHRNAIWKNRRFKQ